MFKYIHIGGLAVLFFFFSTVQGFGQASKCGFAHVVTALSEQSTEVEDAISSVREEKPRAAAKVSASVNVTVPVVFHIVLTQTQLNSIGGIPGVERRLDSQMKVINMDFAAQNPDISSVPDGFKPYIGASGIQFGLAHTAPDGSATLGYEVIITSKTGFDSDGSYGSGFGFSGAKYSANAGADAWDPESYLNIWIVNPMDNGRQTDIVGLAVPPYLTGSSVPREEEGVTLHYAAFGKRVALNDIYVKGSDQGRTLTHELGHYFGLFHIWGDDDGYCPNNGGKDDGISDTPPQGYPSSGCPTYPKYDNCSPTGNGIMFMNYMDYVFDQCALLFTQEQVARMDGKTVFGEYAFSLSQHPWLLSYPDPTTTPVNSYVMYPNPVDHLLNITFRFVPTDLRTIRIHDLSGRMVAAIEDATGTAYHSFNTGNLHAGMYFVVLEFSDRQEVKKLIVR
ncbi:MAG: T9SS type A sorting domain-containing protein [Chitinophagales bacterium]|nr:zinc-dependent metalloprotease [Chitinophagaceae bacterium]MCB9063600.1 T9SS type A sorting domain-containing protein [Chitinophagales bacterium]